MSIDDAQLRLLARSLMTAKVDFSLPPPTFANLRFVIPSYLGRFRSDLNDREFRLLTRVLWLFSTLSIVPRHTPSQRNSKTTENSQSFTVVLCADASHVEFDGQVGLLRVARVDREAWE